ncbi:MAG: NADPH dehydrogenase NamA [Chloroflexi bacterium]|nr:NADPH dehydrogenase NamA [Chloroflexota bacterium]
MPGLFDPLPLRGLTLKNRVMMSPMIQVSAGEDGRATDWHLVHYGSRAVGGAALLMVEATAVTPEGRITTEDLGLWSDAQVEGLARVASFCRSQGAKIGIQLAHAGRKAWSRERGLGPQGAVAPSALPFEADWPTPHELSPAEIEGLVVAFRRAAERALKAGFDVVEMHAAHGYLLNEFLSPLANRRVDAFGGSLDNRLRLPLAVVASVREVWGQRPLFVRVSATDYAAGGIDLARMVEIARALREAGVDLLDVSSGGVTPEQPASWPGYQIPFAETIRREAGLPTAAVGLITTTTMAEEVVRNGRADLVVLGRELLRNPYWPLPAARSLGGDLPWPHQYERAR